MIPSKSLGLRDTPPALQRHSVTKPRPLPTECIDDFCCEGAKDFTDFEGRLVPHPAFANLADCQKFYVCHNGVTPQEASCSLGQVFNDVTMMCDYPENVDAW